MEFLHKTNLFLCPTTSWNLISGQIFSEWKLRECQAFSDDN